MTESISFLISGIIFGLVAGISPGPLLALVISETLKHGKKEGILIAVSPFVTDLPIVLLSVLILAKLANSHMILGVISIAGALFIGYLAYESIIIKSSSLSITTMNPQSLRKGIITNFLSPHPYLFWIAVGAPTVLRAYKANLLSAICFIGGFYSLLVGSKIITALLIDKSKDILRSSAYLFMIRALGCILLVIAGLFIRDGLKLLGVF